MATLDNPRANSSAWSLVSAMSRLLHDKGTADITLTAGEKEWRLHSAVLAIRSPFFKTEINNIKTEKVNMKMEIKDLNPEGMQQVINFMYGKPIGHAPLGSLLEASERFQMADMKKEVIRIASESISLENAVKIGKLGDLYNIEELLKESAEFIVQNNIEMKEDDLAPKLTTRVLGIFKDSLNNSKQNDKENNLFEMERIAKKSKICTCDSLRYCICIPDEPTFTECANYFHDDVPTFTNYVNPFHENVYDNFLINTVPDSMNPLPDRMPTFHFHEDVPTFDIGSPSFTGDIPEFSLYDSSTFKTI